MMMTLQWFEKNNINALSTASSLEEQAVRLFQRAAEIKVEISQVQNRIARAKKAGKTEMKVK